jgi:hypothetical protein
MHIDYYYSLMSPCNVFDSLSNILNEEVFFVLDRMDLLEEKIIENI